MSVRIKPSPKIRDAQPRRSEPATAPPRFVVQSRVEAPPRGFGGATRILKVAFALFVLGLGARAVWTGMRGPDPHYVRAVKLVEDYEYGKPKVDRNYGHPAYGQALAELARVDPDSKSAEPAQAMRIEIERNVSEFRERQEQVRRQRDAAIAKSRKKRELEAQTRLFERLVPPGETPECEFAEADHSGEAEAH